MEMYTIGHSTHTEAVFLSFLNKYEIQLLVDVRSFPGSRYVPQFNKENMEIWLPQNNIKYLHLPELGGRRHKDKDIAGSLVDGWKNAAFRNYAAYSLTPGYEAGIDRLISLAKENKVCYMCSEAVPWRCHRLLISNTLVSRGISIYHIISETDLITHELGMYGATPVERGAQLIYPPIEAEPVGISD